MTSCEQYEYSSPSPGVLEIRFKTKSTIIPFSELNNFVMNVTEVIAIRNDGGKLLVFQDLRAIDRKNSTYNILQPLARDSMLVIGQVYAPPGNYSGVNLQMSPQGNIILDGYRRIGVAPAEGSSSLLSFVKDYHIAQLETTYVTLTIDLDSSLQKRAENYSYRPYYYISSVETYRNGAISGYVYEDIDGNNMREAGEPGLQQWWVKLSGGKNDSTRTTADGMYSFTGLKPRPYVVSEDGKAGWVQTFPLMKVHTLLLKSGERVQGKDFGNFRVGSN